jgi:hypothetical protein
MQVPMMHLPELHTLTLQQLSLVTTDSKQLD